jgi:hypothetical protein
LYSVDLKLMRSLKRTTVLPPRSEPGTGMIEFVAPRRRLPRCQPIAMALLPDGHGCSVCTCSWKSNRVALKRCFSFIIAAPAAARRPCGGRARRAPLGGEQRRCGARARCHQKR